LIEEILEILNFGFNQNKLGFEVFKVGEEHFHQLME